MKKSQVTDEENKDARLRASFDAAVKYLADSPRSKKEVREKLYDKGFHRDEVEYALKKAEEYRYLDDAEYSKTFVESYKSRYGRNKLEYRLVYEKGVDKEIARVAIEETLDNGDEFDTAKRFAQKRLSDKPFEKKDAQKIGRILFSKGYGMDVINRVIQSLSADDVDID